ncbi:CCA tRNA nucleotidyltransferase [Leptospira yasudae]|uniref:[cytidine(C)-cytidine(C)-adenosine (A)]-adding enzyme n=1 Tax=Leptospira yasudae TaxID=2202201 RepID=A0A6N4QRT7_9LEPT|nr:[cytidine(C)-cytidine(C)-adenosine (A)]-adding enzyme [Leptospira yasudae]TGL73501.1 [cytidine(C)-cytidine(C)-adenosine (A)]-adding enzyme [Leptospira yasudae]TGL82587.1 [cytidine(C)-cytidine(C)-adenosine (A)]-adding enzyme [Leptospira yasudae]TGL83694.1 [cytidine(C)-cytidine(C)-adenosine (A)]-adding enzyme [Leptospira yasudae]
MTEVDAGELISRIPDVFREDMLHLTQTIRSAGGDCYLVGGSVRDLVLSKVPDEFDLTTSLLPETIITLFKRTVPTGIKHGTVTVLVQDRTYEITTFRKDADYLDGRRPETVEFGVSLSEDLKRRDFTMNALALDLEEKRLVDEHNGLEDIRNQIIRTIGDPIGRFTEDGLRPIRAIRFVSSLGFTLEEETAKAIVSCRNITAKVSRERVHDELNKTLRSNDPSHSLRLFQKFQILELFTNIKLYPIENETVIETISKVPAFPLSLRLSFLHAWLFGSFSEGSSAKQFMKDLRYSNQNTKDSLFFSSMLSVLLSPRENSSVSDAEIRKTILHPICVHAGREHLKIVTEHILNLATTYEPALKDVFDLQRILALIAKEEALLVTELALRGEDILRECPKLPPKEIGSILGKLLSHVLENPNENTKSSLISLLPR